MDVMSLVVGALGGGLVTMVNQWLARRAQKRREEARALREARIPLYRELLRPWAATLAATRVGKDPVQALAGSADSPEYNLVLYEFAITASDDLIRSFSKQMFAASLYPALSEEGRSKIEEPQKLMADFIFQLRRDLGPPKTRLERDDVIRVLFPSSGNADISEILRETPAESSRGPSSATSEP